MLPRQGLKLPHPSALHASPARRLYFGLALREPFLPMGDPGVSRLLSVPSKPSVSSQEWPSPSIDKKAGRLYRQPETLRGRFFMERHRILETEARIRTLGPSQR